MDAELLGAQGRSGQLNPAQGALEWDDRGRLLEQLRVDARPLQQRFSRHTLVRRERHPGREQARPQCGDGRRFGGVAYDVGHPIQDLVSTQAPLKKMAPNDSHGDRHPTRIASGGAGNTSPAPNPEAITEVRQRMTNQPRPDSGSDGSRQPRLRRTHAGLAKKGRAVAGLLGCLAVVPAAADDWAVSVAPYLRAAGIEGTTSTLPGLPAADVDISFGDVFEDLKPFGMVFSPPTRIAWGLPRTSNTSRPRRRATPCALCSATRRCVPRASSPPGWRITWSRTTVAPACASVAVRACGRWIRT